MSIPSPCTSVCQIDSISHLCKGCWRTLDEIAAWSTNTEVMKQKVWLLIEQRKSNQGIDTSDKGNKCDSGNEIEN
ncbi:MAG TPA: DUF1289 domain-containing protein [Burkholderiaceae bacterium]|nr:DUF1289 domain-containing protein [Burkholderiaceae bacterium]